MYKASYCTVASTVAMIAVAASHHERWKDGTDLGVISKCQDKRRMTFHTIIRICRYSLSPILFGTRFTMKRKNPIPDSKSMIYIHYCIYVGTFPRSTPSWCDFFIHRRFSSTSSAVQAISTRESQWSTCCRPTVEQHPTNPQLKRLETHSEKERNESLVSLLLSRKQTVFAGYCALILHHS